MKEMSNDAKAQIPFCFECLYIEAEYTTEREQKELLDDV
jgi:hypothetical protein